jgi:hypothetical protein
LAFHCPNLNDITTFGDCGELFLPVDKDEPEDRGQKNSKRGDRRGRFGRAKVARLPPNAALPHIPHAKEARSFRQH